MRIVNIGSFLLPVRFSLSAFLGDGRDGLRAALRTALPEFQGLDGQPESEVLLDFHRSAGAQRLESILFDGTATVDAVGAVRLQVTNLGVGFVVAALDLPDDVPLDLDEASSRSAFKQHETRLSEAVAPAIASWSQRIATAVPAGTVHPRPAAALPDSRLLWWHRVALAADGRAGFPAATWYGTSVRLADGVVCEVGSGATNLRGGCERVLDDVVTGLMVATQEWLVIDEAKRRIADHLVGLTRSRGDLTSLDAQYTEVLQLTETVALRNLVLNEELRYLANARSRIKAAACETWGTSAEAGDLEQRATALRDLFALHRDRVAGKRDDRRNRYIFVFTALTLVQASLVWYDFLTEDDVSVANHPRPMVALVVLTITIVVLLAVLGPAAARWWRRRRTRRMAHS